ncbi:hypothetical protein FRC00_011757 [Tulasnella sp. 408]|nr:hypothetical protein FRC00_011757 [Tulasnella sp. 408]
MPLNSDLYVLEPSESYPFFISATRYRRDGTRSVGVMDGCGDADGLTLIAAHATGSHKESWEPLLERLFHLAETAGVLITEAWAIDAPNHGDAGTLNAEALQMDYPDALPFDAYAHTIGRFLTASINEPGGPGVNFLERKLIALGHCLGSASAVYLHHDTSSPVKFQGMILIEVLSEPPGLSAPWEIAIAGSYLRRDTWSTREEAFQELRKDPAYGLWSDQCLRVLTQHGLKDHLAANYDPFPWMGVTSKCTRVQEAATYRGTRKIARLVPELLPAVAREVPVHCIWAGINPRMYAAHNHQRPLVFN